MYQFSIVHLRVTYSLSRERLQAYIEDARTDLLMPASFTPDERFDLLREYFAFKDVLDYGTLQ